MFDDYMGLLEEMMADMLDEMDNEEEMSFDDVNFLLDELGPQPLKSIVVEPVGGKMLHVYHSNNYNAERLLFILNKYGKAYKDLEYITLLVNPVFNIVEVTKFIESLGE
jgi:hypothetical protein